MELRFTPEEERFRREVREFIQKELPPRWRGPIYIEAVFERDDYWEVNRRLQRKLGEKGWLALAWPREYGGQERSPMEQLIFAEEIAYHRCPGFDFFGVKMLAPTLLHFGTEEQKRRFLPPIARGEVWWCQGFSEPNAGSDLASLQTRAEDRGDHFVVNGQKIWTSGAHRADWCFLLVRTDPTAPKHKGISFLLVDMKTPGVEVRPLINIVGGRSFNEVFFDNVRVPKENLVGEKNEGWKVATALLNFERSGIERVAACRRMLEEIVEFLRDRPVAPRLRQRLAEMAVEIEVGRWLAYRVAWMQSRGLIPDAEASISKVFGSELMQRLGQVGMELLGLYAQLEEGSPWVPLDGVIEHLYLSSLGRTIAGGTSEIQRYIIAVRGLNLPRG